MGSARYISTREAVALAKREGIAVTVPTVIAWCCRYGVGFQVPASPGGRWHVRRARWLTLVRGQAGFDPRGNLNARKALAD